MKFTLPELKFSHSSLQPYIDEVTMHIHHEKHHQAYIDKLNQALEKTDVYENKDVEFILKNLNLAPEELRQTVLNNAGGHSNHTFFWEIITDKKSEPQGKILEIIETKFGGLEEFKTKFKEKALSRFGSGWVWLVQDDNKFEIVDTPNQDSPLAKNQTPVLGLDVWEHAYYLSYQNRRADYVDAWWNIVNWNQANNHLNLL